MFDEREPETGERRHCGDHTGMTEKTKGLQGQISSRLNLQTWLLAIIIALNVSGLSYLTVTTGKHDESITLLRERQDETKDALKELKQRYDLIDKRFDEMERKR